MAKQGPHKSENQKNTKKILQRKASDLIERKGYDNVTVDEICKELGLTKGAFYHYFKSKSDVLLRSYKNAEGDLMNYYNDHIHLPAEEQLRSVFDWYIAYFNSDDFETYNAFTKSQLENFNSNYPITNATQKMILKNVINKGMENGNFKKNLDSTEIADYIFIYISGLTYLWNASHGKTDLTKELNHFYESYLLPIIRN